MAQGPANVKRSKLAKAVAALKAGGRVALLPASPHREWFAEHAKAVAEKFFPDAMQCGGLVLGCACG
jgi:hypothetical protein